VASTGEARNAGIEYATRAIPASTPILKGLAIGDAIGKQTEGLSPDDVIRWYPEGIRGFEGFAGSIIPR
jgi:ADP-ribosylglycohydrolase